MFDRLNSLISKGSPCFFYTDFQGEKLFCCPFEELEKHDIEFSFENQIPSTNVPHKPIYTPVTTASYHQKFKAVQEEIRNGNTYLLNLTQPSFIQSKYTLKEIYLMAHAPYKLRVKDEFVCFSPEAFITIEDNTIHTYPMKGTIDASIPNAVQNILENQKELAEHTMIVDLLRNDLGMVADGIKVEKFRFITTIETGEKKLYQVSSHISGKLNYDWKQKIGEILKALLPAGSISGTPKKMTVNLIHRIEDYDRGAFTGIFGYFDGKNLYSAVAIRFIEKKNSNLIYKSGGGITADSNWEDEYREMIDKIYIP
ncbi:aminodeoxychorismate synthase component I [Sulfuricurvum sp.]|uniref:aminodeoxychorismate synthase component I n=1 Tax=Sulfuricurvum sp. TaxID=2025608 RepID=UPI002623050C|nr:aminodeoxychorismate synthase component I [Sulfuricurvum sp.]MDD4883681.1 aminodeoxychorismate synthase component I [Sulfuricurvum sp.]